MRIITDRLKDDPECISEIIIETIYGLVVYIYLYQLHEFNNELKMMFNTNNMDHHEAGRLLSYKDNTPVHFFFGGIALAIVGIGVLMVIKYFARRSYNKFTAHVILAVSGIIQLRWYYLIWQELSNPIIAAILAFLGIGCLIISFE